jgi:hypothetical protein
VTNVQPFEVFVIAVYGGNSKPSDLKFLGETIAELKQLSITGIKVCDVQLECVLKLCV